MLLAAAVVDHLDPVLAPLARPRQRQIADMLLVRQHILQQPFWVKSHRLVQGHQHLHLFNIGNVRAAGQAAALTAQENGSSVLLLEKGRTTGGSANYSEGIFAVGSYLQKEKGIEVSGTEVLKEEVEYSKYKADSRIWRKYVDASAENVQWLADEGVIFERVQAMGAGEATWHIYKGFGYGAIHNALEPKFCKLGGELLTSTAAVALKLNEDGSKTK